MSRSAVFFFNDTAPTEIYTLSLHDALPIFCRAVHPVKCDRNMSSDARNVNDRSRSLLLHDRNYRLHRLHRAEQVDRKSTRLNSSHSQISYAVFCLKKKMNPPPDVSTLDPVH